MLRLTIIILAGVGLSIMAAFWGLSHNENFDFENRDIKTASISFFEEDDEAQTRDVKSQLVLVASEDDAVATLQIANKKFSPIDLYVTDTDGRRVRTLIHKYLASGTYQISWYGEADQAEPLTPGLYIIILDSNDSRQMLKVVLKQ